MSLLSWTPQYVLSPFQGLDSELQRLQRNMGQVQRAEDGSFKYTCNVHGFKPDEVDVHQEGDSLVVSAEHKHSGEHEHYERTLRRVIRLPEDVHKDSVRCEINENGELVVKAEPKALNQPQKRSIPIQFKRAANQK